VERSDGLHGDDGVDVERAEDVRIAVLVAELGDEPLDVDLEKDQAVGGREELLESSRDLIRQRAVDETLGLEREVAIGARAVEAPSFRTPLCGR